jgi:hypothetical protein
MSIFKKTIIDTNAPSGDAFGRMRTSSPNSLFDAQLTYDLQPLLFEQITNGTGASISHDSTNRRANMAFSSTATGGKAYMQSYEHFRYRAGHSQLAYVTFNFIGGVTNVLKFAGYSDGSNGVEFQLSGTTKQFTLYSDTTKGDETVAQSSWNLDKLDGTGASGLTLNIANTQILVIDLQALYIGRVRCGFDIGGVVVWAHQFTHANEEANPYVQSANLPIRCGMTCTGTVTTTMNFICCTVQTENGESAKEGFHFSQDASVTAASGAKTHLVSIQPKTTFNSITNRSKIIIDSIDIIVTGTRPVHYDVCIGDVLTGTTTFNDVNTTYSATQYNTAGTTSGSPSIIMYSGHIPASASTRGSISENVQIKYPITLDAAGAARALGRVTVLVTGLGGTSDVEGVINWTEIR